MNTKHINIFSICSIALFLGWSVLPYDWIVESHKDYSLHYTKTDLKWKNDYVIIIDKGIRSVNSFFKEPFKKKFEIYIHPGRKSLDSQWQKDWKMPDFKSECWMVASGTTARMDLLSPKIWNKEACEHNYTDKKEAGLIVTHELFHVYHGQLNGSPDFSEVENIDWFVEGFATYASGQCSAKRISEIKKALVDNEIPMLLNDFWTGRYKYGLSGTVVMYIDKTYGRDKLKELLKFTKKDELLNFLKTDETALLHNWKDFITNL
jgi:hypothetical protein